MAHHSGAKAILYAFLANLGIAILKTVTSVVTGSGSMMAEAIHSYADTGNQILLFLGLRRSAKPADETHPLGYGKVTYFWSFIVAVLLFSMGGIFSVYEGMHKLSHPAKLEKIEIALVVLGFSILLEAGSLYGALKEIKKIRGDMKLLPWIKKSANADLIVVLGEDAAAISGLVLAFVFLSIGMVTGNPVFDAIGSIVIGFILILVSIFIAIKIKSLIIGQSASPEIRGRVQEILASEKSVREVYHIITVHFGNTIMLAAKIRFSPDISVKKISEIINRLEADIKTEFPEIEYTFMEPDVAD